MPKFSGETTPYNNFRILERTKVLRTCKLHFYLQSHCLFLLYINQAPPNKTKLMGLESWTVTVIVCYVIMLCLLPFSFQMNQIAYWFKISG